MKKTISLLLALITAAFTLSAQDYHYTLLTGQTGEMLLPSEVAQSTIKTSSDCVSASLGSTPGTIRFEGRKRGTADITCRIANGTKITIHVRVTESLQTLVQEVKDSNSAPKWEGIYKFVRPRNNYSYCYTIHDNAERWHYAVRHFGDHYYYWDGRNSTYHHYDGEKQCHFISDKFFGGRWYTTDGDLSDDKNINMETPLAEYLDYKETNLQERDGCDYFELLEETFEGTFMKIFRRYGRNNAKLADHFLGYGYCCGVRCWVFSGKGLNGINYTFWVDPANGMCLRCIYDQNQYFEVTLYNLPE